MKKKVLKITGYTFLVIALLAGGIITYVVLFLPSVPVEEIHITATPERLARGKYLFDNVAACADCHSQRDIKRLTMPVIDGSEGSGGEEFDAKLGFPGLFIAKNITPYHLKDWTDGELFRAITSGVSKDGHPLFPLMPYQAYGQADKEDIFSIIAYMRTLKPVVNDPASSKPDFPLNIILHTIPKKPDFHPTPAVTDSVGYGKYLVNLASCKECHSQAVKGEFIAGLEFAGGRAFNLPEGGVLASANITPDMETGIGSWTKDAFIQQFHYYGDSTFHADLVASGSFNTVMPWTKFGKMSTQDLSAIYAYLRTLPPVKNKVIKFKK